MTTDSFPPELLLESYSPGIRRAIDRLRAVVERAVPDANERVRPGWGLIGIWMDDPANILRGAHLKLKKVRYVTYEPAEAIPEATLVEYTRQAAQLATMSRAERMARELDRD
jgi:hypothetical protein